LGPLAELERLRASAMPLRFADLEADPATRTVDNHMAIVAVETGAPAG
jgi:hypothetical protein